MNWLLTSNGAVNTAYVERFEIIDDDGQKSLVAWIRNNMHFIRRFCTASEAEVMLDELILSGEAA